MKNLAVVALLIASAAVPVLADIQLDFTYSDALFTLSGVLTASPDGGGVYTATSVDGTISQNSDPSVTYALTLVPPNTVPENHNGDNIYGQDDLLYLNQPLQLLTVDPSYYGVGGIEFAFPAPPPLNGINGGSDIALYANGNGDYGSLESANLGGYDVITPTGGTFTLTPAPPPSTSEASVPEPAVIAELITMLSGVATFAFFFKRKTRHNSDMRL